MSNIDYTFKCANCGKEIVSRVFFPDSLEYCCMDCRKLLKLFTYGSREVASS